SRAADDLQERDHQGRSRRRAAPELPDIPSSLNPPQIIAAIESRLPSTDNASFSTVSAQSRHPALR
ncbi:hypothetical protein, partial [Pseudorhizobium flavum]|uniref:hypothetical protein n=1 Tax=Pseudorhizobium flavum TaxID=1335061 RepID=UPI001AEE2C2E